MQKGHYANKCPNKAVSEDTLTAEQRKLRPQYQRKQQYPNTNQQRF